MTKEQEAIENLENLSEYGLCYTINEKIQEDLETVLNMLKEKDAEIEKKDKMIDLILEFLSEIDLGYYTKEEGGEVLGIMRKYNKEDWKQYFERKAKDGRL